MKPRHLPLRSGVILMNRGILNIHLRGDGRCWAAEVPSQSVPVPPRSSRLVQARIKDVPEEPDAAGVCVLYVILAELFGSLLPSYGLLV